VVRGFPPENATNERRAFSGKACPRLDRGVAPRFSVRKCDR
jgi:hypothetical protein